MESIARLIKQLPLDYEQDCFEQGALVRKRGISSAADLMTLAMFHLNNGCSLVEISEIAKMTGMADMSDVAFMKRFAKCSDWFIAINKKIVSDSLVCYNAPSWMKGKTLVSFDASDVKEKGRSRRIFRLHFALDIFNMKSQEHLITTAKTGESLTNFNIKKDWVVVADRGYTTIKGIEHCTGSGADYILRLRKNSFTLRDENNEKIDLLSLFAKLQDDECADICAYATTLAGAKIPVRICAKRKTADAIENNKKRLKRKESQSKYKMSDEAKTFNEFIVLVTNIEKNTALAHEILETYRYRWQIEIYFKRLKSILDFGELPKKREDSIFAWLNGKLMIALLIESIIAKTSFFPKENETKEYLEGNEVH